jgi:dihydrofolate reductase
MSLDGYIAGPNGEADWIGIDPEVDFAAIWAQFDTLIMGRRTYEAGRKRLGEKAFAGVSCVVFSRTMQAREHPGVTVLSDLNRGWVKALKSQSGKDIWLMGGSELFRSFLDSGYVETVEVTVIPVLLGDGVPLLPPPYSPVMLTLSNSKTYCSGTLWLRYEVQYRPRRSTGDQTAWGK